MATIEHGVAVTLAILEAGDKGFFEVFVINVYNRACCGCFCGDIYVVINVYNRAGCCCYRDYT